MATEHDHDRFYYGFEVDDIIEALYDEGRWRVLRIDYDYDQVIVMAHDVSAADGYPDGVRSIYFACSVCRIDVVATFAAHAADGRKSRHDA